jgi:hypothetical protein
VASCRTLLQGLATLARMIYRTQPVGRNAPGSFANTRRTPLPAHALGHVATNTV